MEVGLSEVALLIGEHNDSSNPITDRIDWAAGCTNASQVVDAAKRELEEETSLIATELELFSVSDDMTDTAHYVTMGFLVKEYSGEVQTMEPETILEWKWFDMNDLPTNLYKPSEVCIKKYKEKKIYL